MEYICFNGDFLPSSQPVFTAADQGHRYGNGLFETMKWQNGEIRLASLHFQRLRQGMELLQWEQASSLDAEIIKSQINELARLNQCGKLARVRLSVSNGLGGIYHSLPAIHYLVECHPLPTNEEKLNEVGLNIDIFPGARKSCDTFSQLKSANFLPYLMAARYATEKGLDDCLVLNSEGAIADASIANLFLFKGDELLTPPITQGCVAGVMRQHIINETSRSGNFRLNETRLTEVDLLKADEVFLSNALHIIRWVKRLRDISYQDNRTRQLYDLLRQTF